MKNAHKVLVISHNAFSPVQNNGKTLESFFKDWDKSCLAQLFFQTDIPDFDFCDNYFNINDFDLLNALLRKTVPGKKLESKNIGDNSYSGSVGKLYSDGADKNNRKGINKVIYKMQIRGSALISFIRSFVWSGQRWKSEKLLNWIEDFNPDVVFFQGSSCYYIYDLVLWICERYNLPLVLELTDDYTGNSHPLSFVHRRFKRKYLQSFEKAVNKASKVITICDYMAEEYKQRFGGSYVSLLNSVEEIEKTEEDKSKIDFIFAGNVGINRHKVLLNIGRALDEINHELRTDMRLNIYTPQGTSQEVIKKFDSLDSINYGGSLNSHELKEARKNSNYLVHVESFDKKMIIVTRLSISTKIPEYLASHRCIFAVGPNSVSSMKYLIENEAGFACTESGVKAIKESILKMISDADIKEKRIKNQTKLYEKNHKAVDTQRIIEEIVSEAVKGKRKEACGKYNL